MGIPLRAFNEPKVNSARCS